MEDWHGCSWLLPIWGDESKLCEKASFLVVRTAENAGGFAPCGPIYAVDYVIGIHVTSIKGPHQETLCSLDRGRDR